MKVIIRNKRSAAGFSLLEVLIAVVILATGLLALAALQSALARNSADAKVRSRIATLLSNEFDSARTAGYASVVDIGGDGVADSFNAATCVAGSSTLCDAAKAAMQDAGLGALTVTRDVKVYSESGADFALGNPVEASDASFKLVTLQAQWTDASGAQRSLSQRTAMSALSLEGETPLIDADPGGNYPQGPIVRTDDPFEAGMIPIAIGGGSETAATNPKPIVVGKNNTLVETKFNILTYQDQGSAVQVQQRIETTVIACRCQYGNETLLEGVFAQNYRPTYWDGAKYVAPEALGDDRPPIAGPVALAKNDNPQSDLCDDCCRDHHDLDSDEIKFDPFRTDDHDHYRAGSLGTVITPDSNGEYSESCRVIRVDGLWRVATDFNIEQFGYVATGPGEDDQAPDPTYAGYYESFVLDFLDDRYIGPSDNKTPEERYAGFLLNDSALDNAPGSDTDNEIAIQGDPTDRRYLHARALMIDHIEPAAQDAIDEALESCTKTGSEKIECLLPHIPFTTINTTELSRYSESDNQVIDVIDGGTNFNDDSILQGMVSGLTSAEDGDTSDAIAKQLKSNSGLAGTLAIDPEDAEIWEPVADIGRSDAWTFRVGNPSPPVGDDFTVNLALDAATMTDGSTGNDPGVRWEIGSSGKIACSATTNGSSAIPSLCQTSTALGPAVTVKVPVTGYNYEAVSTTEFTCPNSTTKGNQTITGTASGGPLCKRYAVVGVTTQFGASNPTWSVTANAGKGVVGATEETTIVLNGLQPNDVVNVEFGAAEDVEPTLVQCNYHNNGTVTSAVWTSACTTGMP